MDAKSKIRVLRVGVDRFDRNYWFLGPVVDAYRDAASTEGALAQAHLFVEDPDTLEWGSFQVRRSFQCVS